ncbi:hypothetical protein [Sinorhizobium meliloti]|uniref:hypothetical protein n=1 Tax=Rhizobium meliloti TaxID=382 RepID=UPI00299D2230
MNIAFWSIFKLICAVVHIGQVRLVSGSLEEAMAEKSALADYLIKTTGLTLSPE